MLRVITSCIEQKSKRPASMVVPASAAKLSVHKEVKGGTKDDGSGSADKRKEKDPSGEEKTSKGLFGLFGLRRSRSAKNVNSAPLSVATKEKATPKEASSKDAGGEAEIEGTKPSEDRQNEQRDKLPAVAVVAAASAGAAVSSDADKNTNEELDNLPEESACSEIGPVTGQEKPPNDDSVVKTVPKVEAKEAEVAYAQIQRKPKSEDAVEDLFQKMPKPEGAQSDDGSDENNESESAGWSNVQDDTLPEHAPLNDQPDFNNTVQSQLEEQDFSPFADKDFNEAVTMRNPEPVDDSLAFGEANAASDAGFEDGFGDSFTAPTQQQVDGFSKEPFGSFNETVDVVLDGDESVFDPDSPISPAEFKAIPTGPGVVDSSSQPNLSTSDVSISSLDSLDDEEAASSLNTVPGKLPGLVDPSPLEKRTITEELQLHYSVGQENGTADLSSAGDNVAENTEDGLAGAAATLPDPANPVRQFSSETHQDIIEKADNDLPNFGNRNNPLRHEELMTESTDVRASKIGDNKTNLHDFVSVSTAADMTTAADIMKTTHPDGIPVTDITDYHTKHLDVDDSLAVKKDIHAQNATDAVQDASSSGGNPSDEAAAVSAISRNDNVSQAVTDHLYEDIHDLKASNVNNVPNEDLRFDDVRNASSNHEAIGDKTPAATSQVRYRHHAICTTVISIHDGQKNHSRRLKL